MISIAVSLVATSRNHKKPPSKTTKYSSMRVSKKKKVWYKNKIPYHIKYSVCVCVLIRKHKY